MIKLTVVVVIVKFFYIMRWLWELCKCDPPYQK